MSGLKLAEGLLVLLNAAADDPLGTLTLQFPLPTSGVFAERRAVPPKQIVCVDVFVACVGGASLKSSN